MIDCLLLLHVGGHLLARETQLPIQPFTGLELMVGESAGWNQMTVEWVICDTENKQLRVWVIQRQSCKIEKLFACGWKDRQ